MNKELIKNCKSYKLIMRCMFEIFCRKAFKYLKNLEVITLRRNSLTVLSDWTQPLLNLKTLDISQNLLVQLTSTVSLHNVEVPICD